MAASTDLWGELEVAQVRTPLVIMKEQAALLGAKTKNLVEATVKTQVDDGGDFSHSFNLLVPALGNYRYSLFTVYHGVQIYPLFVMSGGNRLGTEEEFLAWLAAKLSSPETKRIISNLLSQVAA